MGGVSTIIYPHCWIKHLTVASISKFFYCPNFTLLLFGGLIISFIVIISLVWGRIFHILSGKLTWKQFSAFVSMFLCVHLQMYVPVWIRQRQIHRKVQILAEWEKNREESHQRYISNLRKLGCIMIEVLASVYL